MTMNCYKMSAPILRDIKYRYVKLPYRIRCQKGYEVYCNDELIGHVISDCWSFEVDGQRFKFATRREASERLRKLKEAGQNEH